MTDSVDREIIELGEAHLLRAPNSRAAKAIRLMLDQGFATTRDLNELGYDHPPRAIGDVKDLGLPIVKIMIRASDGKRMASYTFGSAADIRAGQVGRTNFSKTFKAKLIARYGAKDEITGVEHSPRSLQIDHRIPYRVAGDIGLATNDVEAFMLLDAKSQRAKSWSCEQCENFIALNNSDICRRCFWAFPDDYDHIAMKSERRVDVIWRGEEALEHDQLEKLANQENMDVAALIKKLGREEISRRYRLG